MSLDCASPASAANIRISPEALGYLPTGFGSMSVELRNSVLVQAGDWSLEVRASRTGAVHNGEFALGAIDLE